MPAGRMFLASQGSQSKRRRTRVKTVGTVAKIAAKVARRVVKTAAEHKFFDVNATNTTTGQDYNGAVFPLADIAQGDDLNNRTGRTIKPIGLRLIAAIKNPSTFAANSYAWQRFVVFQDMLNTGVDPVTGDVLENVGSAQATITDKDLNSTQSKRFRILYDRTKHITYQNPTCRFSVNLRKLNKIEYAGSGSTSNGKGMLYFITISDQPPAVGNLSNLDYQSRLTFTDV